MPALLHCLAMLLVPASDPPAPVDPDVGRFLTRHCIECHSAPEPEARLDLERIATDLSTLSGSTRTWRKIQKVLRDREMPPEDEPRPDPGELQRILAWLEANRPVVTGSGAASDGPAVSLRRLNRFEYENTVRDLLGVEFDSGSSFPADEVGHGFDNMGDVLSLSDLQLEKYLEAAEWIAARALVRHDPAVGPRRFPPLEMKAVGKANGLNAGKELFSFATTGEARVSRELPRDGVYALRARAFASQAGPEVARLELRLDGKRQQGFEVEAVQGAPQVYETRMELSAGEHQFGVAFVNDYYQPDAADPADRDRNLYVTWMEIEGPLGPPQKSRFHLGLLQRIGASPEPLRAALTDVARRAYRRPPTELEIERLASLAEPDEAWEATLQRALIAILVSPNFLFRVEQPPAAGSEERPLDDHELATRLAYFLWSSMPDEALFRQAELGRLREGPVLLGEVDRMLGSARSGALVESFAGQWLQLRSIERVAPDPRRFPGFDQELREAMAAESSLLFEAVLREDRPVRELLTADFTFLNQRLADHYGLSGVRGSRMRRVALDGRRAGGLLHHAAILTLTSEATRTSAVKRGKWVLETILDDSPPPPPADVMALDQSAPTHGGETLRQRMERHRSDPKCLPCHERMDPIGFALENYDALGRWRELDAGKPIDASGELPDGRTFVGPAGLQVILQDDDAFVGALARNLLTYALGKGLNERDHFDLEQLLAQLEPEPTLQQLIHAIVSSNAFRTSRGGTPE